MMVERTMEFESASMSDSLDLFFQAAEETLRFEYLAGDETPITYPHTTGWRTMPYAVFVHVVGARATLENGCGQVHLVNDGEAFCIPAGMRHKVDQITLEPAVSRWSHVNFSLLHDTSIFPLLDLPPVFVGSIAQRIGDINAELAALGKRREPTLQQLFKKKSLGFLLAATLVEAAPLKHQAVSYLQHAQQFVPVLRYIDENLHLSLSREDLANMLHLSPSRFYTLFKQIIGVAPSDYVQNLRLRKAQQLLMTTHLTVHEIARQVGYGDLFYFSRLFKKRYGLSPSNYRNQL